MEEADLVRRAQRGDTRAFGRLVETHQARIYATLVRIVRDPRTSDSVRAVACTALGMLADPGPLPAASVLAPGLADLPWTGGLAAAFATL